MTQGDAFNTSKYVASGATEAGVGSAMISVKAKSSGPSLEAPSTQRSSVSLPTTNCVNSPKGRGGSMGQCHALLHPSDSGMGVDA